jgi:hypothetical protein
MSDTVKHKFTFEVTAYVRNFSGEDENLPSEDEVLEALRKHFSTLCSYKALAEGGHLRVACEVGVDSIEKHNPAAPLVGEVNAKSLTVIEGDIDTFNM